MIIYNSLQFLIELRPLDGHFVRITGRTTTGMMHTTLALRF